MNISAHKPARNRKRGSINRRKKEFLIPQKCFAPISNTMAPLEPVSTDQIEAIHLASLEIIQRLGIKVLSSSARDHLKKEGCTVNDNEKIVKMDPVFVEKMIAKAPTEFFLTPRNTERRIKIGGNSINFGLVSGPPNIHDCINGRRSGTLDDFKNLIKLGQSFNAIHFMGNQAVATTDLPANTRHLDCLRATIKLSDKVTSSMSIGSGRVRDAAQMLAIGRGISIEEMRHSPTALTNINVNSPRVLDKEMSDAAMALAEIGQAVIVTPFTLMGAMTPVTFAAAIAQQNAEALFTIALIQSKYPLAPVVYGGFTSNVDMKSGAPAFGTPENSKANLVGGQLARRYNLPYRTSACNASNTVDAQSVHETQMSLWGSVMGWGNMVYHSAGWLEGGLVASFEKLIVDIDMIQSMMKLLEPVRFNDAEFGIDAMEEVGPGGHFFGSPHTLERYKNAFHEPITSDWQNNENWLSSGGLTSMERATGVWQDVLKHFEPPAIDPAILEELDDYVAKRKEEIGNSEPK